MRTRLTCVAILVCLLLVSRLRSDEIVLGDGNGSRQCLRGQRSESRVLTALSRELESPQLRVMI